MAAKTRTSRAPRAKVNTFAFAGRFNRLAPQLCSKSKAVLTLLLDNPVSISLKPDASHRRQIEQIAAAALKPIPIHSLAAELDRGGAPRGGTCFGEAAIHIDQIAATYENMHWWITDKGLRVACLSPASQLSKFDQAATDLMKERWVGPNLSKDALVAIAEALDQQGFVVKENLQNKWRKAVAQHNQCKPKTAIKTFRNLASHNTLSYGLRRRLYVTRAKFNGLE